MSYKQIKDLIENAIKKINREIAAFENRLEKLSIFEKEAKAAILDLKRERSQVEYLKISIESNQAARDINNVFDITLSDTVTIDASKIGINGGEDGEHCVYGGNNE